MHVPLRLGTRGSQLALWQARTVAARLEARGLDVDLVIIRTSGDRLQEAPLSEIGGKRLFVKELEDALLRGEIDVAVHSAKDMPAVLPDGFAVAATLPREDPRDALVLPAGAPAGTPAGTLAGVLSTLGPAARVGTGSVRRSAQLGPLMPGATFTPIRGNVDTRLRKLDGGDYDLLVLAAAGLKRLGLDDRITVAIPADTCVPAPGQGIIALEIRAGDDGARQAVQGVHDLAAFTALEAERAVVEALGGGCQLPLGALALVRGAALELHAVVCSADGARAVKAAGTGSAGEPAALGGRVAAELAAAGAAAILDEERARQGPVEGSY
jgi:hydroxymethylbilane synthase